MISIISLRENTLYSDGRQKSRRTNLTIFRRHSDKNKKYYFVVIYRRLSDERVCPCFPTKWYRRPFSNEIIPTITFVRNSSNCLYSDELLTILSVSIRLFSCSDRSTWPSVVTHRWCNPCHHRRFRVVVDCVVWLTKERVRSRVRFTSLLRTKLPRFHFIKRLPPCCEWGTYVMILCLVCMCIFVVLLVLMVRSRDRCFIL